MKHRSWLTALAVVLIASTLGTPALAQVARVGPTFTINRLSNGNLTPVRYTDVAWDSTNHVYLVVWGAFGEILGRFVTPDGQILGDNPFVISGPLNADDYRDAPRVEYSPDAAAFMVVWRDNRLHPQLPTVFGRSLAYQDASGVPRFVTSDFLVTAAFVSSADSPAIAYSTASREFLVLYNRGYDIRGRQFNINGELLGSELAIGDSPDYEFQPNLTYNPNLNEFLVVWRWYSDPFAAGTIQARRVQAGTGANVGGAVNVDFLTGSDIAVPAVAFDPAGNSYFVAWYRASGIFSVAGRMLTADGNVVGERFTVAPTANYVDLDVSYSARAQTFFTVFAHHDILDIFGVRVSTAGVPDPMVQVTVTASVTGTDYGRLAASTDTSEWLVTNNIWWNKATGQRVSFGGGGGTPTQSKLLPANASTGLGNSVNLTWDAVTGASYEVCVDTIANSTCDTSWQPTFTTSMGLTPANGTYYWQVRSVVNGTTTEANFGVWWTFTVGAVQALFNKQAPANGATGVSSPVALTWGAVAGATYSVCVDTSNNSNCDTSWQPVTATTLGVSLSPGTYYWQVRAHLGGTPPMADAGVWWSFTVGGQGGGFVKQAPGNGASGVGSSVTLQWSTLPDAGYSVCWDTTNNNTCDGAWWPNGGANTRTLTGLANGTYYWQARAQTASGTSEADGGTWISFTVGAPVAAFGKQAPTNGATGQGSSTTLTWGAATGVDFYGVCVDTINNNQCDTNWQAVGLATSQTRSGLAPGTYYWHVQAQGSSGIVEADGGTWWSFTVASQSGGFVKQAPGNGASGLGSSVTLQWSTLPDAGYSVCWDTTNNNTCDGAWWPNGAGNMRTLTGLANGTYYWQARAQTASGTSEADGGAWISFTVGTPVAAFGKQAPTNGATGQGSSTTLTWGAAAGANFYEVCVDTINNNGCDTTWQTAALSTSQARSGLAAGTYYWQVRAQANGGPVEADGGTWWSFTVGGQGQGGGFVKQAPGNGVSGLGSSVTVQWSTLPDAGYSVCWDTSNNNTCDGAWWPNGAGNVRTLTGLANGTYYWQVRAQTAGGTTEADGGAWISFTVGTPVAAFGKQAPTNGAAGQGSSTTLTWGAATAGANFYEVCVDTINNNGCDTTWQTAALSTSQTRSGLATGTYYWQVRAQTNGGPVEADGGTWWSFTVGGQGQGGGFVKQAPGNGTSGLTSTVSVQWSTLPDAGYSVCWDTTNNNTCDGGWWPNGASNVRTLLGLANGTYYWQVRAQTASGTTEADGGIWISFTVGAQAAAFNKQAPTNGATGQGSSTMLTWGATAGANFYEVCVDTINNNGCDTNWQTAALSTSQTRSGLATGTYYWQVRAQTNGGPVEADGGTWWSFTVGTPVGGFGKQAPGNGASGLGSTVTVQWAALSDAGYWVCWDTTNNNTCDGAWWPNGGGNVRALEGLSPGTYYWQVRAQTASGITEADGGTWWSFTVGAGPIASLDLTPMPIELSQPAFSTTAGLTPVSTTAVVVLAHRPAADGQWVNFVARPSTRQAAVASYQTSDAANWSSPLGQRSRFSDG